MIVSFHHNFIYFRPKKTGSSAITEVLRPNLDDGDLRRVPLGEGASRKQHLHSTASEAKAALPSEFWASAFKFASERHPYEKAVSLAFFKFGKQQEKRFKGPDIAPRFVALLERVVQNGEYRGFDYYSIDGKTVVDDFVRHETFEADLRRIGARLGIAVPDEMPRRKASFRLDPRPARQILSDTQKETICRICREEFELLGYET